MNVMRWTGALSALGAIAAAVVAVQVLPWPARPDFPPFVMTIEEWNAVRVGYADGRTIGGTSAYRLDYRRRDDWTLILVSDDLGGIPGQGIACRSGTYGYIDVEGVFHETSGDLGFCNGVGRWIHYGIAWSYRWRREVADGKVTYTDPGERIVFDLTTGLPLLYEAGLTSGTVGSREVYRLER